MAALALASPLCSAAAPVSPPSASAVSPETVLAAFLINFIRFTEWPDGGPSSVTPYSIGISGNRPLEDEILRLADRQLIRGHRLRVVRVKNVDDLNGLHVAYFDSSDSLPESLGARDALPLLRRAPVLTVSDAPNFTATGGIVRIFREDKALHFEIAPDAAHGAGLTLSSRLLALAKIYRPAPGSPNPNP